MKKFKRVNTVGYWDIGKEMQLVYTIETTRHDEEVKIDFSNIIAKDFYSLNEVMSMFNTWQQAGYNNIQIITRVKHNDNIIIEDSSSCLELLPNNNYMKQLQKDSEELEQVKQEKEIQSAFIEKHKAQEQYKKFKEEKTKQESNNRLHWYEYLYRPMSIGCQPKDFLEHDPNKGKHGIVAYNRPLSQAELNEYELREYQL